MSKENAVLMPAFACLIELFFFSSQTLTRKTRFWLKVFYAVLVSAMVLGAWPSFSLSPICCCVFMVRAPSPRWSV